MFFFMKCDIFIKLFLNVIKTIIFKNNIFTFKNSIFLYLLVESPNYKFAFKALKSQKTSMFSVLVTKPRRSLVCHGTPLNFLYHVR